MKISNFVYSEGMIYPLNTNKKKYSDKKDKSNTLHREKAI